ncbi:RNase adapter RapZ [Geotalea sp. SG265]|uniref:RNase adapter RapZ n=1 Tax=Geotalea sp. SG265 TaxID=2922867 RepID=UPI001FAF3561|nr:RNase adapter RapZ [Geotalea sp. SG265]
MRILIITGLSGSGKSTAVRALEDEGFFCQDNLPVALFPTFVDLVDNAKERIRDVALVMDIRGRDFNKGFEKVFQEITEAGHLVDILFFDATDEVLIRRFSETRRRHPASDSGSVPEGIRFERQQLAGLRSLATQIIDTSELNVHQLKDLVITLVKGGVGGRDMTVHLQSFGYRFGIPLESDLVMDVRFLPNPYFIPELKQYSGLDPKVREYVLKHEETGEFLARFKNLLEFLLPGYRREGKSYLTISIGCTGGRHRSVVITEEIKEFLKRQQLNLKASHRDMEKG